MKGLENLQTRLSNLRKINSGDGGSRERKVALEMSNLWQNAGF